MKKITNIFLLTVIFTGIFVILYLRVPIFQEKMAFLTEDNFVEENIYSDLQGIANRLDEEILKGSDSFIIYLKNMDVNEINRINSSLDGVFGSGESYQQLGVIGEDYKKISITIRKTTNYYVYAAYMNKQPIPDTEYKATRLYNVLNKIMMDEIKPGMTDYEKEVALHDYLITHCVYSNNADQESGSDIYRAYGALVNGNAVCNGYAEAFQLLLTCAGVNSRFVLGTADGIDHAWNLVELDGKWYHVDSTWNDPKPDQGSNSIHPYFNVSDEILEKNHVWKREWYPKATDMTYNYYKKNDAYFTDFASFKDVAYDEIVSKQKFRYEGVIENYTVKEDDMQFVFVGNAFFKSVTWQSYDAGKYRVLVVKGE